MIKEIGYMHNIGKPEKQPQLNSLSPDDYGQFFGSIHYKTYPRFPQIPIDITRMPADLEEIQLRRESWRAFNPGKPITFTELSNILYFSSGIKPSNEIKEERFTSRCAKRMHESAGGMYPLEVYVIARSVENIQAGIYHYNVLDNTLERLVKIGDAEISEILEKSMISESMDWFKNASVGIIFTAIPCRQAVKYGASAYQFALKEAGAKAHALALHSTKCGLGICESGAFNEEVIAHILDLDQSEEIVLSLLVIGKRNTTPQRGE